MNDIEQCMAVLRSVKPYSGYVPKGFLVDFMGCLTDAAFRTAWGAVPSEQGGRFVAAPEPVVELGEFVFEVFDWLEAARQARDSYTMVTLGACYGHQAVGAFRALQLLNPMPARLVGVEADPQNFAWLRKNFRDNGINPDQHWLIQAALSDTNRPVLFPVGSPGSGANDCRHLNDVSSRSAYARQLMDEPNLGERVHNLIVDGDTGFDTNLVEGWNLPARIKFVSAVTLADVLGPLDRVDLLESDLQKSEEVVFPPAMDLIKAKVKRVHLGTHAGHIHIAMLDAFASRRFAIVFNYEPQSHFETPLGAFDTQDGVITAVNLDL